MPTAGKGPLSHWHVRYPGKLVLEDLFPLLPRFQLLVSPQTDYLPGSVPVKSHFEAHQAPPQQDPHASPHDMAEELVQRQCSSDWSVAVLLVLNATFLQDQPNM